MAADTLQHSADTIQKAAEHGEEAATHTAPELPNIIHALEVWFPGNPYIEWMRLYENQIFAFVVVALIGWFFWAASRKGSRIPGRLQATAEMLVEGLLSLFSSVLGEKEAKKHFPFLGSLFIFILGMNWFGLVPLMKSPTAHIIVTGSLAFCVFLYVQTCAVGYLGLKGFFFHLMGEPRDFVGWVMVPLFLPLHILEEFIKPLSLACRLYGNIFGEDTLLGVLMLMGAGVVIAFWGWAEQYVELGVPFFGIPFHFPFIFLAILVSVIQALVFTLLSTVYISMVLPHHEHEEA